MSQWSLDDIVITRVLEFENPLLPPEVLFPDASREAIDRHRAWLEPRLLDPATGALVLAFHSLVVRTPRHTIVVDTCSGNHKPRPKKPRYHMSDWPYLQALQAAVVRPEEVDYVMCTHLHVDHVGWNTRLQDGHWVPTFPNARYLFGRREWDHWQAESQSAGFAEDPYFDDSVLPIIAAGQAVFVDDDFAIEDGIRLESTPGHTPGHLCLHVESGGRSAVLSGDLMHHAVQCAEPQWNSCFCVDPELSRATRRRFLEHHADSATLVLPAHFPTPTAGRIVSAGEAFRFVFDGAE